MTDRAPCPNCNSTGWTCYEVPGAMVGGVLHMRWRTNPCHLCNAGGSWKQGAQNVVNGEEPRAEKLDTKEG